ncbi:MAG: SCO family protein [Chlamydiota bacterium]
MRSRRMAAWAIAAAAVLCACAWGQTLDPLSPPANQRPPALKHVGIEQRLNQQIPPSLEFRDEAGNPVRLGQYFGKGPLILNFVYFHCPMLCGQVLQGLTGALRAIGYTAGRDFTVLTVSFDPHETPEMAAAKKKSVLATYGRPEAEQGWHFLTGSAASIAALTQAAGFQYQYNAQENQFAHPTAIMTLTPKGKVSQYYYGIEYAPRDLRLGLVQASNGQIGTLVDEALLYCYRYDPKTGKYSAIVSRVLRISGALWLAMVGVFLVVMFRMEPKNRMQGRAR